MMVARQALVLLWFIACAFPLASTLRAQEGAPAHDPAAAVVRTNRYRHDRYLSHYCGMMSEPRRLSTPASGFSQVLPKLGPGDTWLEMGGGDLYAVEDYLHQFPRGAKVRAISYVMDREIPESIRPRLELIRGRFLEHIPPGEIGKAKLITCVFGPFTYTRMPDIVLQKYLDALAPDGDLFLVVGSEEEYGRSKLLPKPRPDAMSDFVVESRQPNLAGWLLTHTKGINVERLWGTTTSASGTEFPALTFRVRKDGQKVQVPKLREESFVPGEEWNPVPYRTYSSADRYVTAADIEAALSSAVAPNCGPRPASAP